MRMIPKEQQARAEIDRISQIPLRQRTAEDRHDWDVALHVRDFAVMDREREEAEKQTEISCARILKGFIPREPR